MKAVIFIDVQKDFIDGTLKNEKAIEVTPKIVEFAKECVKNGHKIYATRDTHEKSKHNYHFEGDKRVDEPIGGYLTTLEGKKLPVEHCIEGTDGWMIDNNLMEVLDNHCTFVNKPTFGSFDLVDIIEEDFFETYQYVESVHCRLKCCARENEPLDEIVICGCNSGGGILANAIILRSKFPNTKITVMKNLCMGMTDNCDDILKSLETQQIEIQ